MRSPACGLKPDTCMLTGGLPHSEIRGSKGALPSPRLIAECHVLHRLLSPRHPPNALHALDPIQKTRGASRFRPPAGIRSSAGRSKGAAPGPARTAEAIEDRSGPTRHTAAFASASLNLSQPACHPPRTCRARTTSGLGQCIDLERLLSPPPHPGPPRTTRRSPQKAAGTQELDRPPLGTIRKSVSCFSLFTMSKTIKVQTNDAAPMPPRDTTLGVPLWWVEEDLNLRPHAYQACALTT